MRPQPALNNDWENLKTDQGWIQKFTTPERRGRQKTVYVLQSRLNRCLFVNASKNANERGKGAVKAKARARLSCSVSSAQLCDF